VEKRIAEVARRRSITEERDEVSTSAQGHDQRGVRKMQYETVDETKLAAQRLRPLVLVVVAAKLAVSALLLTTVQFPTEANTTEIVALR
jgi:hypothetical protein